MIKKTNIRDMETFLWHVHFYTVKRVKCLPLPGSIAVSIANSAKYRNPGINRVKSIGLSVFQFTLEGKGMLRVGNKEYEIPIGSGFLTEVGQPDMCYYYPEHATLPYKFIFFSFYDFSRTVRKMNKEIGYVYDIGLDSPLIKRMFQFSRYEKNTVELSPGEGASLVNNLLAGLADAGIKQIYSSKNMQLIREAHQLIEANLYEPYNASLLAEELRISQEHLSRIFKRETSTTPYQLITRKKIYEACLLIKETRMKCQDIAVKLGYDPGSHFSRLFKKETGMNPLEFREKGIIPLYN